MRLLSAKDIALRYGVSERTARRYMHSMGCLTSPLRVSQARLEKWEKSREGEPVDYRKSMKANATQKQLLLREKVRAKLENR